MGGSLNTNHIVQKHNFLLNNLEDPLDNRLHKYREKKSTSPLNETKNAHRRNENYSIGLDPDRKGFSTEKKIKGLSKDNYDSHLNNNNETKFNQKR